MGLPATTTSNEGSSTTKVIMNIMSGAVLQCAEAATLGMPFEVWKTEQISSLTRPRYEGPIEAFQGVLKKGGIPQFWSGTGAKMIESATKGALLMVFRDLTIDGLTMSGMQREDWKTGSIGAFMGGVCQTITMSPMTHVIVHKNRYPEQRAYSSMRILRETGLKSAFASAPPMAWRQGSNWALRQGFAQAITGRYKAYKGADLTAMEKVMCGFVGGALACVNQPFEVLRVVVQARRSGGDQTANMRNSITLVYQKHGLTGFYAGLIPRIGLSAWQTLFMVTFAEMLRDAMKKGH